MGRGKSMTQNKTKKKSSSLLIKKLGIIIIGLFLLYVIAGFWVVPPLLKPRLEKELSNQIGRKVTIEEIKLNPLALSSSTTNLTVYEIDGEPFAGFKELLINAELSSIVRWAVTFKEIRVLAPFGVLKVLPDQTLNISDILTKFSQPEPGPEQQAELPRAIISKLQVEGGKFTVEDLSGAEPIIEKISPISFTLTNLSTLAEREGAFKFVSVDHDGGNYKLDGQLSVNPIRVHGSYSATGTNLSKLWKHIEDQVSFQIRKGTTVTSGNYLLELIHGTLHAKLQDGVFELKDFQLTEKGKDKVLISIPSFSVQGISADVEAREIIVEQVKTAGARIESWIAPDGTFNLQSLPMPDSQKLKEMKKSSSTEPKTAASSPWHATIHKIEVNKWGAAIEDRTLPKPVRFTVDDLTVSIENLENKKNSKAKVALSLQINQAGTVEVNGSVGIDPLSADMEVFSDKIALKSFQPYVDTAVNAQIISGTTSSKGRILYRGKDGQPQISYQGELSLDGVEVKDRLQTEDFINQEQLKASGVVLDIHPNKLHVADVLVNKLQARVTIDQNGTVNVVQAFTPVPKKGEKEKENLIEQLVNFLILQIKGPIPMSINLARLNNFSVDFIDGSITPSYKTHLEITKGTMKGLSSDPSARADFKIEGTIDRSATINSAGQMNPLNAMHYAKVDFSLKDFKLKPVSPYASKYAGYKIAEGKLHLDLKYRFDNSTFTGDNKIFVDQLTLGDKVDSPDATKLPVALGVALLKGVDGRITLQVPVSGNVKDPQFDFGQTITSALTKTMANVSSSPFSTFTDIGGFKGEELRFIEFESGFPELSAHATKKLNALAKFLNERSALTLDIEGTADRHIGWGKMSDKQAKEEKPSKDGGVFRSFISKMSGKQAKKEKPSSQQKTAKVQQKDLAKDQAIDDNQLKKLAQMRANIVKDYLVQKGKVSAKRVQLKPVKITSTTNKEHGRVELYLSAQ
jgi:hypothetical protein